MAAEPNSCPSCAAPSTKECITAMREHSELFEKVAEYPPAAIYKRFRKEWLRAITYVESEVHRCARITDASCRQDGPSNDAVQENIDAEAYGYTRAMDALAENLLLLSQLVDGFQKMSTAPLPSKANMHYHRIYNGRRGRAANGEMASIYRDEGQPVPSDLATAESDDLEPMAEFIREYLMNPVIRFIVQPPKLLLHILPMYKREPLAARRRFEFVHEKTLLGVANACVYVLAILVLIAPIATFTVVQEQTPRMVIMSLFCLLLAASAQLMGPRSMPTFILVAAYFQTMVVFVANTNDRQVAQ